MPTRSSRARNTMNAEEEPLMSGALEPSSSSSTADEQPEERATKKRKVNDDNNSKPKESSLQIPRVGVGVFALRAVEEAEAGNFIVGRRKGSMGSGTWALPGGHLEFGESLEECASRELFEETGIDIPPHRMRHLTTGNSVFGEGGKTYHYITIFMGCGLVDSEEPELMEPEKCEGWHWINWDEMKTLSKGEDVNDELFGELFVPLQNLSVKAVKEESIDPFDPYECWKAAEDKAAILGDDEK